MPFTLPRDDEGLPDEPALLGRWLWAETAPPGPELPVLGREAVADVAIVGAGYTGLAAALHVALHGRSVVLLDAGRPGSGASGRNGGQVIAGLKEDPDALLRRFGPGLGGRLVRLSGTAPDGVFGLIERHAIACNARASGWLQPAADVASLDVQAARRADWLRLGTTLDQLDRDAIAARLGGGAYAGGLYDPRGGTVQPLAYARGLARTALDAGARLYRDSAAESLRADASGWTIRTADGGRVRAAQVALCTNGYTDGLHPGLAQTIVPVVSMQVATDPLPPDLRASILPGGEAASDAQRLLVYFRLDPDGRFVIGGRGRGTAVGVSRAAARLTEIARRLYPLLRHVAFPYAWGGRVALTLDHLPHLHRLAPGLWAALGYNGRGIAMATALGGVLADGLSGVPEAELPVPVTKAERIPLHGWRAPAVELAILWASLRDRGGRVREPTVSSHL